MRLEPVFLVAPRPKPPSMTTRRAFLLAGGTFAVGAAVGGACGYSIGAKAEAGAAEGDLELAPSGDVELDELRRLAVKAPISELVEKRLVFLNCVTKIYPKDLVLWRGVARLVDAVLSPEPFSDRRIFAKWIAQVIEAADPAMTKGLVPRLPELRKQK